MFFSSLFFSEGLIRVAFQSLQLVVTDFLPLMPCTCIKVVVDVAGKFGLQPQELNISLTAIGLLVSYVTYCLGFVRECSSMITTALSFQPRFSYVNVNTPLTRAASFCRVRISFTCCVGQFSRGEGSLYDLSLFVLK